MSITDRGYLFPIQKRVEHIDTDASGVVHFARYPSLMESAILENLDAHAMGLHALERVGLSLVVVEVQVKYFAPSHFLDCLSIEVKVKRVQAARFFIEGFVYRVEQDKANTLLASGIFTFAVTQLQEGTPCALPKSIRETLKECMNDACSK
ncbi:acyl-CoA thioesterase [Hazenella sp. IB182357]|uniref:Acyl-CoA thioesterase n=1 Tax=Polycladospora coralii TaxID=2771432 RepID=A0A926N6Q6_9BACL|nr:thioesterase family protein [Polycladospora coralii]MBD1372671.1 acyl-CoA thioesterase [Polycladospora coralii]